MLIFKHNLKRVFTSKIKMLILVIMPMLFVSTFVMSGEEIPLKVVVYDQDNTEMSEKLIEKLGTVATLVEIDEAVAKDKLLVGTVDYILWIEEGMSQELSETTVTKLTERYYYETSKTHYLKSVLKTFLINAQQALLVSETMDDAIALLEEIDSETAVSTQIITSDKASIGVTYSALGFNTMFMLYMSIIVAALFLIDKENNILVRLYTSPLSKTAYLLQNLASFIVIGIIQTLVIFAELIFVFQLNIPQYAGLLMMMCMLFSFCAIAMSMLIISVVRNEKIAYLVVAFLASPMSMLGGAWFDTSSFGETVQNIAKFIPSKWIMDYVKDIVHHADISRSGITAIVLCAFTIVFFLASLVNIRKFI